MKCLSLLAVSLAATATALSIARPDQAALGVTPDQTARGTTPDQAALGVPPDVEKFLIKLSPDETRWVTEDEKWALRRVWIGLYGSYYIHLPC